MELVRGRTGASKYGLFGGVGSLGAKQGGIIWLKFKGQAETERSEVELSVSCKAASQNNPDLLAPSLCDAASLQCISLKKNSLGLWIVV